MWIAYAMILLQIMKHFHVHSVWKSSYAKYVAPPTESMSKMATKVLEQEQLPTF